ncbi:MAG: phospholipase D family protein [Lachnospiraceae bacterium]|nr:phospholipase D family protein [Lachnospiraceae bacterium]
MDLISKNVMEWLFEKKQGMELKNIIATTFTINPEILLDLIGRTVCCTKNMTYKNINEKQLCFILAEDSIQNNPVYKKLTIFSDDCIIPPTRKISKKYIRLVQGIYIPNCLCRIAMENSGSFFHPKILIAHYKDYEHDFIKFAILSKNLTHSVNMQEICILFESKARIDLRNPKRVNGESLQNYIRGFLSEDNENLKGEEKLKGISLSRSEAQKRIDDTLDKIGRLSFEAILPEGSNVSDISLQFVTPNNFSSEKLFLDDVRKSAYYFCCSDSISKTFWDKKICQGTPDNKGILISNLRSWARYDKVDENKKLNDPVFNYAYYLFREVGNPLIHAKFAELFSTEEKIVWLGSSNFTENGFERNYEADVRITYNDTNIENCGFAPSGKAQDRAKRYINVLNNKPFSLPPLDDVFFAQVRVDDLGDENENKELTDLIKNKFEWICKLTDEKKIVFLGNYKNNIPITQNEKNILMKIKQYHIVTGIDNILFFDGDKFRSESLAATETRIPWYGKAVIMAFEKYGKDKTEIPINIDPPQLQQREYKCKDDIGKLASLLVKQSFNFMDIIPPEPEIGYPTYDVSDSFDIKLGKYLAKNGDPDVIINRIGFVKNLLSSNDEECEEKIYGADEEYVEEMDESLPLLSEDEKSKMDKRLEQLRTLVERLKEEWRNQIKTIN